MASSLGRGTLDIQWIQDHESYPLAPGFLAVHEAKVQMAPQHVIAGGRNHRPTTSWHTVENWIDACERFMP